MSKTQLLNQFTKDSEQRNFFAQTLDKMSQAEQRHSLEVSGFFTPEEQGDFMALLQAYGGGRWVLEGGYAQAERQVFLFPPPWQEEIPREEMPLSVICAQAKGDIGHRDVLGSMMSLGLSRRKFGDILVEGNQCQVMVLAETAGILLSQWSSIGRYGIDLKELPLAELAVPDKVTKEITTTVASLRLDSMVSAGFSLARSKAVAQIASGRVAVNHRDCQKADRLVAEGDLLTCRGLGKCHFVKQGSETRKGRVLVTLERYL